MITPAYLRMMSQYNRTINAQLYQVCNVLSDAERKANRGAFFGSIHGTLNHILWADARAVARMTGARMPADDTRCELHAEFDALHQHRRELDETMVQLAQQMTQPMLDAPTTLTSVATGRSRTWPTGAFMVQLFNHQTHHRGQVSTLLSQLGHDVGVTDIPWLEIDYVF